MKTQEIRITASITLEVPIELSHFELFTKFNCALVSIPVLEGDNYHPYFSKLEIIEIEEEAQIYGTED
jgi:hypothetical protein